LRDEKLGGIALEIAEHGGEIGRGEDGVEVVIEDDPGVIFRPLCARQWSREHTRMSQHAAVVKTGSHSTMVAVMKCASSGSWMR